MSGARTPPKTASGTAPRRSGTALGIVPLASLWVVWGTSWPAMRMVFLEMPVWQFRAVSCAIGGAALLSMGIAGGQGWRVPRAQWGTLVAASFFNITIWHVTVGYGLYYIGAGYAVILCYTLPIWTAILSSVFLKERPTVSVICALLLGSAGVALLLSANFAALGTNPVGAAFVLAAAVGWAVGTIIFKRTAWTAGMMALAGWQLLIGLIPIAIIALLTERFTMHQASDRALLASLYVVFVAIIAGYALWFRVVATFPAVVAGIGVLVIPVIGVVSGALVLGEPLTWREGTSLLLILGAVALVVFRPAEANPT